jgi:hypothetical protein
MAEINLDLTLPQINMITGDWMFTDDQTAALFND